MEAECKFADTFTDASACVCGCVCVVHVYVCVRKHCTCAQQCVDPDAPINTSANDCLSAFTDAFAETFSSPHLCCAACAYNRFLITLPGGRRTAGGKGRAANCHTGSLERQVAVETWCVRAVSFKQQLQKPTTERVLLADLHVELWSLFVTSWKLTGWSVHVSV